jgi:tetratricopeptide (TPR) repeat protein
LADTRDPHTARRVERLLGQAERVFEQATGSDNEPVWIQDMGAAELAAEAGCAWRMIGKHQRAAECADQALRGFGTAFPRSTQFNKIHRAQAAWGLGQLDQALSLAGSAIPAAKTLTSSRTIQLVRAFDAELAPRATDPKVRQWRDFLRAELPAEVA